MRGDTRRGFRETAFCAVLTFCELTSINYRPAPVAVAITEFPFGNDENIRIRHISHREDSIMNFSGEFLIA